MADLLTADAVREELGGWRTLTFRCVTHSAGGVTHRDIELARRIDDIVRSAA
ncbi:4a-hydroxytetrahydrobiopterin dehydratase [Micromonospora sp. NBC_00617]|uniref:4a-hydroxytetrahydrobiopterin dehydratase n=1 Tax=Micromonospora sp. NBC_00617 TaxID=2903587 RepID=UPI0030DEFE74